MKYIPLFLLIQIISLVLQVIGLPVCLYLAAFGKWRDLGFNAPSIDHFPKLAWIWDNDEDGIYPWFYVRENLAWSPTRICFTWTVLRNPVANLKHVPGVSKVGRPLFYRSNGKFYVKAGWMSNGYPACSFGAGRGY